jgi:glycosyltransferase involved in cell wall biosynthesis
MEIVTASNWMKECVSSSFLSKYPVSTIFNGVDLNIFRPITAVEQIYSGELYKDKFILLGVASPFTERKGLNDFFSLSSLLPKNYLIILVGVERHIAKSIPPNIKIFTKTENQQELVSLYNLADVYLNLTYEDTFPTTNLESLACGTPVITYNTGGSIESVDQKTGGVVEKGDLIELKKLLLYFEKQGKVKFREHCRYRAENCFDIKKQLTSYFEIYDKLLNAKFKE